MDYEIRPTQDEASLKEHSGRTGDWIQTFRGEKMWPLDPRPEEIFIEDIAHALSLQCRFTGHVRQLVSVAQHSVMVSENCPPEDQLWGLLHDAAEAYLSDVSRPIKRHVAFQFYRDAEAHVMMAVCRRFGLPLEQPASVSKADELLLVTEARDQMAPLTPGWRHTTENGYPVLPQRLRYGPRLRPRLCF